MIATLADLQVRYDIDDADLARASVFLEEADTLVKAITGQNIEEATDTVTLDGNGRRRLQLPQIPVTEVTSVSLDGVALIFDTEYRWDSSGGLWRVGRPWPLLPGIVSVTNTHGYAPPPPALVGLVCRLAKQLLDGGGSAAATGAVKSLAVADYTVTYDTAVASGGLTVNDAELLASFMVPVAP